MAVLTITATSNPSTAYFDKLIPKASYVSLLSRSFYNSWHTLKRKGQFSLFDKDGKAATGITISEVHYTLESMEKK